MLGCIRFSPNVQAVSPPPDGGYPGGNTAEGTNALLSLTSGVWNSGFGFEALSQLTVGNQNTATGLRALANDTNGGFNTATGVYSLFSNTSGFFNSATGAYSLANNISGNYNTANGYAALYRNTGDHNTATGFAALFRNTTGIVNTATGSQALQNNTTGHENTATGLQALLSNTTGSRNTATGTQALYFNIGNGNTANGFEALFSNTTGGGNTATGVGALPNNTTGSANIALGFEAGTGVTTANHVICIGASGQNANDTCYIGQIFGGIVPGGATVIVDGNGHLGTIVSSQRFKEEIKPMERASEALFALKPVTFRYKKGIDPQGLPQFGLVAEDVEEVNPDLVVRDKKGKVNTVRYEAVNAMLLNEFLKEHRKAQEQEASIRQLKSTVSKQEAMIAQQRKDFQTMIAQHQKNFQSKLAEQDKRIEALTSGLQKVSAQLEVTNSAPQTVLNK